MLEMCKCTMSRMQQKSERKTGSIRHAGMIVTHMHTCYASDAR